MDYPREWTFGAHRMRFEPPKLLLTTFRGTVTLEDAQWMVGVYQEVFAGGPFYILADITGSHLPSAPRKYLAENVRAEWTIGIAYVGAEMAQRMVSKALSLGMLFSGKSAGFDTVFLDSVEEGRAWVEAHRPQSAPRRTAG